MRVIKFYEKNPEKSAQMSSKRVLPMERLAPSLASTMQALEVKITSLEIYFYFIVCILFFNNFK